MLIKCPECELQVSDKAITCPHCGYPLKTSSQKPRNSNLGKHRRLPNGFGQITEIKNRNLRNTFRAMITTGFDQNGRPICKLLKPQAYFHTYNDAYQALVEYNKNPYDLDTDITMEQLYNKWLPEYEKTVQSASTIRTMKSAWSYCGSIYRMRVKDLRARHIKCCMEEGIRNINGIETKASPSTQGRIKSLFNLMLDYAVEYEIIDRNYARTFYLSDDVLSGIEERRQPHIDFTNEEISVLWSNLDKIQGVDMILYQCYSGWRPQELGLLEVKNVDLEQNIITGGMKTEAGIMRAVPIHSKIREIVVKYLEEAKRLNSPYLFNCTDTHTHRSSNLMTYEKYKYRFDKIIKQLKLNEGHRPHDPRVQFVTWCKKYKVDEYAIKYMVGHRIEDITERVYTKREIDWLNTEIEKIS